MDKLEELREYLPYIIALTKSFGGPVSCHGLQPGFVSGASSWEEGWWRSHSGTAQTKDLSILSLGNGTNHREHHGRRRHLKVEKIIRSFNTFPSQR